MTSGRSFLQKVKNGIRYVVKMIVQETRIAIWR